MVPRAGGDDDGGVGGVGQAHSRRGRPVVRCRIDRLTVGRFWRDRPGAFRPLRRSMPAAQAGRFHGVAGTPDVQVGIRRSGGNLLHRLVGRAILAQADGSWVNTITGVCISAAMRMALRA